MRNTYCMCSPIGVCCAVASAGVKNGENKHTPNFDTDLVYITITPLQRGPLVAGDIIDSPCSSLRLFSTERDQQAHLPKHLSNCLGNVLIIAYIRYIISV